MFDTHVSKLAQKYQNCLAGYKKEGNLFLRNDCNFSELYLLFWGLI